MTNVNFAQYEVKVLEYLVSRHEIRPDNKKVQVIKELLLPKDVIGVKSFMGVINFYCKFIPDCATLTEPLIKLTKGRRKKGNFVWEEDQEIGFNILKNKLVESEILKFLDFKKEFIIETNALSVGLGAVLCQEYLVEGSTVNLPVAYASKSLSKAEKNYVVTD